MLYKLSRRIKGDLDELITPKIKAFKEASFAKGTDGTLHGQRSDSGGYKFLRVKVYGPLNVKTIKGCDVTFHTKSKNIEISSDSKEFETSFSVELGIGITEFELFLDDSNMKELSQSMNKITVKIKRKKYEFEVTNSNSFKKLMK